MGKRIFFLGLTSGIIAATAAIIFKKVHEYATYSDFSGILTIPVIVAINMLVCMVASLLFWGLVKWLGRTGEIIFNGLFLLASFATTSYTFAYTLPLDIEFPELFPGLAIPMHFIPALCWFAVKPLFFQTALQKNKQEL